MFYIVWCLHCNQISLFNLVDIEVLLCYIIILLLKCITNFFFIEPVSKHCEDTCKNKYSILLWKVKDCKTLLRLNGRSLKNKLMIIEDACSS